MSRPIIITLDYKVESKGDEVTISFPLKDTKISINRLVALKLVDDIEKALFTFSLMDEE